MIYIFLFNSFLFTFLTNNFLNNIFRLLLHLLSNTKNDEMDFTTWDILRPGCPPLTRRPSLCQALINIRLETLTGMFPRFATNGLMVCLHSKSKTFERKKKFCFHITLITSIANKMFANIF